MKLNSQGFAITGILYTVFILFLMILLSVLGGLNIKRKLLEKNINNIKETLEEVCNTTDENIESEYEVKYQGKYTILVNGTDKYQTYLTIGQKIKIDNMIIQNIDKTPITFLQTNPTNVSSAKIIEICTTDQ